MNQNLEPFWTSRLLKLTKTNLKKINSTMYYFFNKNLIEEDCLFYKFILLK